MNALILAAGRGSRLGALTDESPKGLTYLCDRPLMQWQIEALREAGATKIGIVLGYCGEKIREYFCSEPISFFENPNWSTTNMVYTLFQADDFLQKDTTLISYSDIFYDASIPALLADNSNDIAISCGLNVRELWEARMGKRALEDAETLKLDKHNFVLEIGARPETWSEVEAQYMGLIKLTPKGWQSIKNSIRGQEIEKLDCTSLLQEMIKKGISVSATLTKEKWGEVDTEADLNLYEQNAEKWIPSRKKLFQQIY